MLTRVLNVGDRRAQMTFGAEVDGGRRRRWAWSSTTPGSPFRPRVAAGRSRTTTGCWAINYEGVVNGIRAFLPILLRQDSGAIVNTSSVFGLVGIPYQSAYCASKFAVRGFTDSLRQELRGTGVHAITVHPGG